MVQNERCKGANSALEIISGKWMPTVLYHLQHAESVRFNELMRLIPQVTQKMLTSHLRELEEQGIVQRKIYAQVPPKVEYSLTEYGRRTLVPIINLLQQWGIEHLRHREQMKENA